MAATFSTSSKSTAVTLSNSNLTATVSSSTGVVAATVNISGKTYFELTHGTTLSGTASLGLIRLGAQTYSTTLIGGDSSSTGVGYRSTGAVYLNNTTSTTLATFTVSNNIGVAFDPTLKLVWFRVNGGNWNNDVIANQDPANGIGGIDISSIGGTLTAGWSASATASATFLPDSGTWVYSAPTGFYGLSTQQSSAVLYEGGAIEPLSYAIPDFSIKILQGADGASSDVVVPLDKTLPTGYVSTAYSTTITAGGGSSPYTFQITAGVLPTGLSLNGTTGVISGTPTATGTSSVTIQATDSYSYVGSTTFSLTISTQTTGGASNYGYVS